MNASPPIRLAHVTRCLDVGGQEKLLTEFARCADRSRFDLLFVSLTGRGPVADMIEEHGWPVVTLNAPDGLSPRLVLRLRKLFQERRIAVVHTHDDRPLIYGVPAARWAGARAIHTHHHGKLPGATGRGEWLARLATRLAHGIVAVSQDSARYLRDTGVSAERLLTVRNGIDPERFAFHGPQRTGPAVIVARLSPEKDIATLLRAAARVAANAPKFRLEIAGDGPCREELVRLSQELGLGSIVKFHGEVRDIPGLLRRASLFVLSSQTEGISLTLLEAMASGLPVVATRVGGNPEVVIDCQTGRLVPAGNPAALAEAIASVWGNPENGQILGRAGRRRVENVFDVRGMVAQYESLYIAQSLRSVAMEAVA